MPFVYDIIGLAGAALIIAAYLLLQTGKLSPSGILYSSLNAAGALLIIISLIINWNLAAFIIEVFWLMISLYGLYKFAIVKKNQT